MYYLFRYEAVIEDGTIFNDRSDICGMKLVAVHSRHDPSNGNKESLADAKQKLTEFLGREQNAKVVALKIVENLTIH